MKDRFGFWKALHSGKLKLVKTCIWWLWDACTESRERRLHAWVLRGCTCGVLRRKLNIGCWAGSIKNEFSLKENADGGNIGGNGLFWWKEDCVHCLREDGSPQVHTLVSCEQEDDRISCDPVAVIEYHAFSVLLLRILGPLPVCRISKPWCRMLNISRNISWAFVPVALQPEYRCFVTLTLA